MNVPNNDLAAVTQAIESLREELQVTRQVLDEIREELSWANNNTNDLANDGATMLYRQISNPVANQESTCDAPPTTNQRHLF